MCRVIAAALTCGERRPGREDTAACRCSIPCVLDFAHQGDHADDFGDTWPRLSPVRVCCGCGRDTTAPVVVGWTERTSGPPYCRVACPDCAPTLASGPSPYDELPRAHRY